MPTRERFPLRKAYGGTGRPDKCLVVKSLDSSLRTAALRNMESTAITTRELKAGMDEHRHYAYDAPESRTIHTLAESLQPSR